MNKKALKQITEMLKAVSDEGRHLPEYPSARGFIERSAFSKWITEIKGIGHVLGDSPWSDAIERLRWSGDAGLQDRDSIVGMLEGIVSAVERGCLDKVEDLVLAEAFGNLLEQAEHLNANGYWLAAAVLGRAVLEEHLRNWCARCSCTPPDKRPQINHFKDSLYKNKHLDKIKMKQVEAMAAIGNSAAHNDGTLQQGQVAPFLTDVARFLNDNPLP